MESVHDEAVATAVAVGSGLRVSYSIHLSAHAENDWGIAIHHGICHTREHFLPLIGELNQLGVHVAMIDQQSEVAGRYRNCIGANSYLEGMREAVDQIETESEMRVGSYALHSMGAMIGEEMQQRYSDLQRPTVFLAPVPVNGAWPITWRIFKRHPLDYVKAVLRRDIHSLAATAAQVRELFFDQDTPEHIVETTTATLKHAPFWMYFQLVLRWLLRTAIRDDGEHKLLLFSDTDEIFHPRQYEATRLRYSNLVAEEFAGGHDFFIQYARETADRLADFHRTFGLNEQRAAVTPHSKRATTPHRRRKRTDDARRPRQA